MIPSPIHARRRASTARRLALSAALVAAGCAEPAPEWQGDAPVRWRELTVRGGSEAGFSRVGESRSGIDFVNDPSEEMTTLNQHLANGAGVAIGDVDGDDRPDLLFANTRGENALFLNRGDFRFRRAGEEAGVRMPDRHPTGVALADVDADGDLDALVSSMGAPVALLENDGLGRFTDRSLEAGLSTSRAGSTLALADVDADGDLDVYAANYRLLRAADVFSPSDRRDTPVLEQRDGEWVVNEMYRDYYRVAEGPAGVMSWEFGEADDLYINDGTGRFVREPIAGPRFHSADGEPIGVEPQDWGLSARFRDLNGDGAPDLYVANDFESPDHLWMNDGSGRFTQTGAPALRKTSHASMSVAFGDVDADGGTDIFVADMRPMSTRLAKTQVSMLEERRQPQGDLSSIMQVNRNTLLLALEGGGYAEVAQQAGVDASGWTWGTDFIDVDLDGHLDLVVANGHRWDPLDADTGERLRASQAAAGADWHEVINLFPQLRLPNLAFRNLGDGTFSPVEGAWGLDAGPDISHGLASGDLDGDGDHDLVVNRLGDPALVLRNEADAPRLAVRLVGLAPNTRAIGARIEVVGGPVRQAREIGAGGVYLSHSDAVQSFAAGDAPRLTIEVRWPGGGVTVVDDVLPNRLYEITQTGGEVPRNAEDGAGRGPIFEAVAASGGHVHVDAPYESAFLQPLMPRNLSRLGPGVAWVDADGDRDPDLVIGGGFDGAVSMLRNDGGRFTAAGGSPKLRYDAAGLLPEPEPGELLIGVANYETPSPAAARGAPPAWRARMSRSGPGPLVSALASDGSSAGPLASADIDGDGDLDVFRGGRVYQGAYPIVPESRIFRREADGSLVYDSVVSAPVARAGLVSGATFTDIDGDGDPDLALALDWGPPRLFINEDGRLVDRTRQWGLLSHTSWWNGVTAGDLDGDGRMDLILTSWGRNTGLSPALERPLMAYWADFDRSGSLDVLLGTHDPRIGAVAPLSDLVRLSAALPFVRRQTTPTYAEYADASVARVLGPTMQTAQVSQITTLDHTLFLNRGGSFEARALAPEAQRAPAHGVSVADFDGDGNEDVLLAQNFFPNELIDERWDSGLGLLMLGDGAGGLGALGPDRSGLRLSGDQRGLAVADFDADGRLDAAIGQNSGPTLVVRNVGGEPGVRVRLLGDASNPRGVGATLRLVYADGSGPAREVRAGSGYWSADDPLQVLGARAQPLEVEVRWPGGEVQRVPVPAGTLEVEVRRGG